MPNFFGTKYEFCLQEHMQPVQQSHVLCPGGHQIDSCGFKAGMPKYIREFRYVPACLIEGAGKKMAEVVRKYFAGRYAGFPAEGFHFSPNLLA